MRSRRGDLKSANQNEAVPRAFAKHAGPAAREVVRLDRRPARPNVAFTATTTTTTTTTTTATTSTSIDLRLGGFSRPSRRAPKGTCSRDDSRVWPSTSGSDHCGPSDESAERDCRRRTFARSPNRLRRPDGEKSPRHRRARGKTVTIPCPNAFRSNDARLTCVVENGVITTTTMIVIIRVLRVLLLLFADRITLVRDDIVRGPSSCRAL